MTVAEVEYTDCPCCAEVFIGLAHEVCDDCHAAGCDPSGEEPCEIPECLEMVDGSECHTRASWMHDRRWHSNCEEPCPNAGKSWDDAQALARSQKPQPKPPIVFRVPPTWQRMSRIDESLRHAVSERRWDESKQALVPCAPYLTSHEHGYPVYYVGEAIEYYGGKSVHDLCAECASKAEHEDERIVQQHPNWEDPDLFCEECNERIESAYAEDEHRARGLLAQLENGNELTGDDLSFARQYTQESENSMTKETIEGLKRLLDPQVA